MLPMNPATRFAHSNVHWLFSTNTRCFSTQVWWVHTRSNKDVAKVSLSFRASSVSYTDPNGDASSVAHPVDGGGGSQAFLRISESSDCELRISVSLPISPGSGT